MTKKNNHITNLYHPLLSVIMSQEEDSLDIYYPQMFHVKESLTLKELEQDTDLDAYLLQKIRTKIGNRCIDMGYVKKDSIHIISRSIGKVNTSHFNGEIYFHVKVEAAICKPSEGQVIRCKFVGKNKIGIFATCGPLQVVIAFVHQDPEVVKQCEGLVKDQEFIVTIINYRFSLNDPSIKVIGKIIDMLQ